MHVAHLTLMFASKGLEITAVEPNDGYEGQMVLKGQQNLIRCNWFEGIWEVNGHTKCL